MAVRVALAIAAVILAAAPMAAEEVDGEPIKLVIKDRVWGCPKYAVSLAMHREIAATRVVRPRKGCEAMDYPLPVFMTEFETPGDKARRMICVTPRPGSEPCLWIPPDAADWPRKRT